jgi:hypothetical protein
MGVTHLHEPRALVGAVQIDGPVKMFPVIREDASAFEFWREATSSSE